MESKVFSVPTETEVFPVPMESEVFPMSTETEVFLMPTECPVFPVPTESPIFSRPICLYSVHSSLSTFGGELCSSDGMSLFPAHSEEKTLNSP
jgi:hypothetical protein